MVKDKMIKMERQKKGGLIVPILIIVILILLGIIAYAFVIRPSISGFVIEKQIEAKDITLASIITQVQQKGYVQIVYGNESIVLVPYQGEESLSE